VGLVAGWLTGKIMGGPGKRALMDIIIGLAGAFAGGFIMRVPSLLSARVIGRSVR
jgi:uncharacterized membrane protein YeaQ/YmgE (transglycosylase-associated protein family)